MENIKREFLNFKGMHPSRLILYKCTDSTNERAKRFPSGTDSCDVTSLSDGVPECCLFIADTQAAGRGRLGRSFESPFGTGLYMSFRIRLGCHLSETVGITPYAAVSAARAIERLCSADIKIKWVNDLYIGERKLAGILTESIPCECGEDFSTLVIGIGINVLHGALSPEVSSIATSLEDEGFSVDRARLACEISHELLSGIEDFASESVLSEYRLRSNLLGESVTVITQNKSYSADVIGIGDAFELIIRHNGKNESLISADVVKVKKISG